MMTIRIRNILLSCLLPALALTPSLSFSLEVAECESRLQSVDERIASGKYPESKAAMAKQMRDSVMESCPYLTEDLLASMMEGFEQILPTRTEEERRAYEQAKRDKRKKEVEESREVKAAQRAERARNIQERAEQREREKLPVSPVLMRPPTGTSTMVKLIERPDNMQQSEVVDWDYFGDSARILYRSYPLSNQEGAASAAVRFYVLLARPDGTLTQHEVARFPYDGQVRGALRRGYAEAIFQRPGALTPTPESTLERRSLPDGNLLSTAKLPDLGWTERSWGSSLFFRAVLDNGDLLFIGQPNAFVAYNSAAALAGNTLAWATVSPDGTIAQKGSYSSEKANTLLKDWAALPGSNLTFLVYLTQADQSEPGIKSDLDTPIVETIEGVELRGFVGNEMRLVSFDSATSVATASAGFDRFFVWKGREATQQTGSISDVEGASKRMHTVARSNGAFENVSSPLVRIDNRVALLVDKPRGMESDVKTDGLWLREYAKSKLVKQTNLRSAVEHLDVKFSIVASAGDDTVYAYGSSSARKKAYVIRLDGNRKINAYSEMQVNNNSQLISILADKSGVWILTWQRDPRNKQVPGIERVRFAN